MRVTTIEKKPKKNSLNEKNFSDLKKFFNQLIINFGDIQGDDKNCLNCDNFSESELINNFKNILKRRLNNGEFGVILLINRIKENKQIFEKLKDIIEEIEDDLFGNKKDSIFGNQNKTRKKTIQILQNAA